MEKEAELKRLREQLRETTRTHPTTESSTQVSHTHTSRVIYTGLTDRSNHTPLESLIPKYTPHIILYTQTQMITHTHTPSERLSLYVQSYTNTDTHGLSTKKNIQTVAHRLSRTNASVHIQTHTHTFAQAR